MFSQISQFIMAQTVEREASELADSLSVFDPKKKTARTDDDADLEHVPDVKGMGAKDAVYMMKKRGLSVALHGAGAVTHQSMTPGTKVVKGSTIKLTLE